jgi:hypothetical protein
VQTEKRPGAPDWERAPTERPRRPYQRPRLERLGDLRTSVLGPTVGTPDSGQSTGVPIGP